MLFSAQSRIVFVPSGPKNPCTLFNRKSGCFEKMFESLLITVDDDAYIQSLGRNCTTEFALGVDDARYHIKVENGRIISVEQGPFQMRAASFLISATKDTWAEFMTSTPRPGFHDIFAMSAMGNARIEGDIKILLEHLPYFKAVLGLLRKV
jgi:hypothetical protein